jgi:hypothetical protein
MSKIVKKQNFEHSLLPPEYSILTAEELFLMLAELGLNRSDFFEEAGVNRRTMYRYVEEKKAIPKKYLPSIIRQLGGEERYKRMLDGLRKPSTFWLVAVRKPGKVEFITYKKLFTNEFEARASAEEFAKEAGATVICHAIEASVFAG